MSPEQRFGKPVDARSDLYSFCVALWEALRGAPPFDGVTLPELAVAKRRRDFIAVSGGRVPRQIHAALRRGLEYCAERRFADMPTLLAALRPRVLRGSHAGAIALGGALVAAAALVIPDDLGEHCADTVGGIDTVWTDDQRERRRGDARSELRVRCRHVGVP